MTGKANVEEWSICEYQGFTMGRLMVGPTRRDLTEPELNGQCLVSSEVNLEMGKYNQGRRAEDLLRSAKVLKGPWWSNDPMGQIGSSK